MFAILSGDKPRAFGAMLVIAYRLSNAQGNFYELAQGKRCSSLDRLKENENYMKTIGDDESNAKNSSLYTF